MLHFISNLLSRVSRRDEEGQTLVEYGLLLALITLVVIAVLLVIGPAISGMFRSVNDQL